MRQNAELWGLYEEWKQLTVSEGNAIASAKWMEVRRCQRAKEQLQPKIVRVTDALKTACASPLMISELDARVREYVNEMIELEHENSATLSRSMSALQKERTDLEGTTGRLRKLHKSYVPTPAAVWNGYS